MRLVSLVGLTFSMLSGSQVLAEQAPNVILIVADDLGFHDIGYNNPDVKTPHLDQLASEGMLLERFYVAPYCSPTRMALLTGRWPIRWGMQRWLTLKFSDTGMPREQDLLAEMLRREGYGENHAIGKWHLGLAYSRYHPIHQGFDSFYGNYNGGVGYYSHERDGELDWHDDFDDLIEEGYHTDLVAQRAIEKIQALAGKSEPFFLYVPFLAPHSPNEAPDDIIQDYCQTTVDCSTEEGLTQASHWAQVTSLDTNVWNIVRTLQLEGIDDRTVVWFMSDNGGQISSGGDNGPLDGGKGSVGEGGIRVPAFVRYPGHIPGGSTDQPISVVDVVPTLRAIIEEARPLVSTPLNAYDGVDRYPVLKGETPAEAHEHFAYVSRDPATSEHLALVQYDPATDELWKLRWEQNSNPALAKLYELYSDPNETTDESMNQPARRTAMFNRLLELKALSETEGGGLDLDPDGWELQENWAFRDEPLPPDMDYVCYRPTSTTTHQSIGYFTNSSLVEHTTASSAPDGVLGLTLEALGYNQRDGLVYGIGDKGDGDWALFQIERGKEFLELGPVDAFDNQTVLTGGAIDSNRNTFYVFDHDQGLLRAIELRNLTVENVTLSGAPSSMTLGDMIATPSGLRTYNLPDQTFYDIDLDTGVVSVVGSVPFGEMGALWEAAGGFLKGYKNLSDASSFSTGLYLVDPVLGWVAATFASGELFDIDGARFSQ